MCSLKICLQYVQLVKERKIEKQIIFDELDMEHKKFLVIG